MGYFVSKKYYHVDEIIDVKSVNGKVFYLILWETKEQTWEPEEIMIQDIPELIEKFDKKLLQKFYEIYKFHPLPKKEKNTKSCFTLILIGTLLTFGTLFLTSNHILSRVLCVKE